jgi:hypothetical protein
MVSGFGEPLLHSKRNQNWNARTVLRVNRKANYNENGKTLLIERFG